MRRQADSFPLTCMDMRLQFEAAEQFQRQQAVLNQHRPWVLKQVVSPPEQNKRTSDFQNSSTVTASHDSYNHAVVLTPIVSEHLWNSARGSRGRREQGRFLGQKEPPQQFFSPHAAPEKPCLAPFAPRAQLEESAASPKLTERHWSHPDQHPMEEAAPWTSP